MRKPSSSTDRAGRGFTLLEMLVVMVLLGLMTTLALPAMQRWHDSIQIRARLSTVIDALRAGAFAASAERRELTMDEASFQVQGALDRRTGQSTSDAGNASDDGMPVDDTASKAPSEQSETRSVVAQSEPSSRLSIPLPAGWQVGEVATARFLSNGLCQPGQAVLLTERGERVTVRVLGPICGVDAPRPGG